jgi:hypothetical protein
MATGRDAELGSAPFPCVTIRRDEGLKTPGAWPEPGESREKARRRRSGRAGGQGAWLHP